MEIVMKAKAKNIGNDRLSIEVHHGKQIIMVDYKGLKENEMIELIHANFELVIQTKTRLILADYRNCYVTPAFVAEAKKFTEATMQHIDKVALLGIDSVKSWILKGILLTYPVNFKPFHTKEEASQFLTE
ncbi:MAG: hypothetical protein ING84_07420 [Cytophagales bacterium]|nr:hypothetical protein [Cytophagales bacterium]MCA6368998.1 hypothetical protein [Cytophagales bacterium]